MSYRVTWSIDIEADSSEEAAKEALQIMRDPNSTATVFDVEFWSESSYLCDTRRIDASDL